MAPEQTGRLQRPVDARSDLYALGVILFELLTGSLPFEADDPLEWAHRHLAMPPRRPRALDPRIPDIVERMLLRLLEKDPEDRYQTADGLCHDLERCLEDWRRDRSVAPFPLGLRDRTDRLSLPQKLYGRERERRVLLDVLAAVVDGRGPRVLWVGGGPGVGKSSLVRELAGPVAAAGGFLVSGKFDDSPHGVPYAPIADGFGELVDLILASGEQALSAWRGRLRAALGAGGAMLIGVLPQLELVLGAQPAAAPLPPAEARSRFARAFRRFAGAFATREHPLVLLLDDLQWADAASLQLVAELAGDRSLPWLLLVGVYRDDTPPTAAFSHTREALRDAGTPLETVDLGPLPARPLTELLSDALGMATAECEPLQAVLYEKTAGNPLFFTQLLVELRRAGLLWFDRRALTWRWRTVEIDRVPVSANVVELLAARFGSCSPEMRRALSLASCLSGNFTPELLARIGRGSIGETGRVIETAVRSGFLIRGQDGYRFSHDAVREAAKAAISAEDEPATHLRIGRALLLDGDTFEAAGHLNRGRSAIEEPSERRELAHLNRRAAQRARAAAAFDAVSEYCAAGLELLGADAWDGERELAFWLTRERAEAELYAGNLEEAERHLSAAIANAGTRLERTVCARVGCDLQRTAGAVRKGLELAIDVLRMYGLEISLHPQNVEEVERQMRERLGERPVEALLDMPLGADLEIEAAIDLLARAGPNAYLVDPHLHHLMACLVIELTLQHGIFAASVWGLAAYGFDLSVAGRYAEGDRFAQVALGLVDRHRFDSSRAFVCTLLGQLVWTRELRVAAEIARDGIRSGIENGDVLGAAFCWLVLCLDRVAAGAPLAEVEHDADEGLQFALRARYTDESDTLMFVRQLVRALCGRTERLATLTGPGFDEPTMEESLQGDGVTHIRAAFYAHTLQAQVFGGDFAVALATSERLAPAARSLPGMYLQVIAAFFGALAIAGCDPEQRRGCLAQLRVYGTQLEEWAQACPQNFAHQAALVAGEIARAEGRPGEALELFSLAMGRAQTYGFVQVEALAHESAARLCDEQGLDRPARWHIQSAIDCYRHWGAAAKVAQLEQLLPSLAGEADEDRGGRLDALAVARASQAISSEVVHARLLERLLETVIQHAGARGGAVLLCREGRTAVAATAERTPTGVTVAVHEPPLEPSPELVAESVVNFVSRTKQRLIIGDASASGPFAADPYIVTRQVRSMLCVPMLAQRELRGLLCVENDLIAEAFTPERLAALDVLTSQAVISLENASLYGALRGEIAERKRYEGELQYLADHDWLTGLLNRRRFREELDRELARATRSGAPGAVLSIDLDSFKYVNDTLGHSVGDRLIAEAGALLARRVRRTDVLARIGGDEFAVILPDVTAGEAELVARELLQAVHSDLKVDFAEGSRRITASIGIATFSATSELSAEELLMEADIAMYDAKEAGRNRASQYDSTDERQERMQARLTWGERIRHALENDRLILCAQPILPLSGNPYPRHEVLVRMLDDAGDLIPPASFLPIAERMELIDRIDRWVTQHTIHALAAEQRAGRDARLHVNLSPLSIADEELPAFIASELENAGADGRGLCFEITETAAIINMDRARRFAARVAELGCQLALDDFGSGFASFYYLKHLPFEYLKIDGEFIKDLASNPTDQLVVKSIAEIAHGLGKRTIAEFVSDHQTLELIKRYAIDYAQGFHIAKPTPLTETNLARHRIVE